MIDRAITCTSDSQEVARTFDHQSSELAADPGPTWSILRETAGIAKSQAHGGFHIVTRYDDVRDAAKRPDEFSSAEVGIPSIKVDLYPLILDPPVHYEYRQLLASAFSKRDVEKKAESVRAYVRSPIEDVVGEDAFDFVDKLAGPLPMHTLSEHDPIATCMNMVNGALDTTTSALTFAAHHLVTHQDDLQTLRANPELIPGAVDEFVRLAAAAPATSRIATVDTQIHGCPSERGRGFFWCGVRRAATGNDSTVLRRFGSKAARTPMLPLGTGYTAAWVCTSHK
jgi:cytochrome P450